MSRSGKQSLGARNGGRIGAWSWAVIAGVISLTWLSKAYYSRRIELRGIGGNDQYSWLNTGGSFTIGILNGVAIFFAVFALVGLVLAIKKVKWKSAGLTEGETMQASEQEGRYGGKIVFGILLMIIGGLSNLYDRMLVGGVVDYWHWRDVSFNMADIVVLTGAAIGVWGLANREFFNNK